MTKSTYGRYLKQLFWIFGTLLLLNAISLGVFINDPQSFYFRPWEYFPEVAYQFAEYDAVWDRTETSDQTRTNFFFYQDPHHTYVSADADGYRTNRIESSRYPILVSGDSAVFGTGLSDNETLPWVLSKLLDLPVFNGGRSALFNTLKREEVADADLIIDMRTEREIRGTVFNNYNLTPGLSYQPQASNDKALFQLPVVVSEKRYLFTSIAYRTVLRMVNDLWVLMRGGPQRYRFRRHTFVEGDLDDAVAAIVARQQQMAALNRRYVFVGIPAKQTLYHDGVDSFTRAYLFRLTNRLRQEGVETINLLEAFENEKGRKLYHPYDTHWNARGAALAAREIADYLQEERH